MIHPKILLWAITWIGLSYPQTINLVYDGFKLKLYISNYKVISYWHYQLLFTFFQIFIVLSMLPDIIKFSSKPFIKQVIEFWWFISFWIGIQ